MPATPAAPVASLPPPAAQPVAAPTLPRFANCADLNAVYPHGVGRAGAADSVSGKTPQVTTFVVDDALYNAQPRTLDRDNDGIACEKL